jgi:ADP-heptose:LPS heptosyltransferase
VQEAIGGAGVKGGILDVLANDAGTLFLAAAEQIPTIVMVAVRVRAPFFLVVFVLVCRHDDPKNKAPDQLTLVKPRRSLALHDYHRDQVPRELRD